MKDNDLTEHLFNFSVSVIKSAYLSNNNNELEILIKESNELKNILGSIAQKCRND